jgi:predicted homoserine dehydrogenase-like protein
VKVVRPVAQGQSLTWADVEMPASRAYEMRREMERLFAA